MNGLQLKPYTQHLKVPYRWSKGTQYVRRGFLVRAEIDGHIGWGEAALPPHVIFDGWSFAAHCSALLNGLDPFDEGFFDELELREVAPRVRCGLASAVLSARAVAEGVTLARYLSTSSTPAERVPVNDLIGDADPEACVQRAKDAIAIGQDTVKVKCTDERELDIVRIKALRDAFPDLRIRLDPNESWHLDWALDQIHAMEQFNIDYIEEPFPRGTDLSTYAELSRKTSIPLALDDSIRSPFHARRAIEMEAAKVLILKPPRLGGPDITAEVIQLAHDTGTRCVITASLETSIGLHLALHCAALLQEPMEPCGMGTARFFSTDVAEPPPIVDGFMTIPSTPGLGIDLQPWWDKN
ncbi:MAG: o-succinylbenzoate synthase [Burkholderiaceae bacterium]|nr:o-succinylbenzoate synthase [Burkholderiaceae bacterium]